jgi:hypothetical protein
MKKLFLVVVLLVPLSQARSQVLISLLFGEYLNTGKVEFGLDGGVNFASMGGIDHPKTNSLFNLGFYFDIKLFEHDPAWMLHTGVIVKSTMGTKNAPVYSVGDAFVDSTFKGGSVTTELSYFNVPIMMKYQLPSRFYVEAGVMASLFYNGTDRFLASVKENEDLSYERSVKKEYHPLDFGLIGGAGYKFFGSDGVYLGVRYYYGLVDVQISDAGPGRFNRSVYIALGIPIGAHSPDSTESKK